MQSISTASSQESERPQSGVVSRDSFEHVVRYLATFQELSLDTETTGLSPFHGDRLFSIIIACSETEAFYFNFQPYEGLHESWVLGKATHLVAMFKTLNTPGTLWFMHNAQFDLHMLAMEGIAIAGVVHCTMSGARLEYNEHMTYGLDACAQRIGLEKSDEVEEYIKKEKLWKWKNIPGKKTRVKDKFYSKVPLEVIGPYGIQDATVCYALGRGQRSILTDVSGGNLQDRNTVYRNEMRLTKTVSRIEHHGLLVDKEYSKRALSYEEGRCRTYERDYEAIAGCPFTDSPSQLAGVFQKIGIALPLTEKGNPSTRSEVLKTIEHPLVSIILGHRDAKSKADFYNGFLYFADSNDRIHPSLISSGTRHGRFASKEPNFQNLTNEEDEDESAEFLVRRAIIPAEGFFFFNPDYRGMEYYLMLDYARETVLIDKILKEGLDVHVATGQMMGVPRSPAKAINFGLLYGQGVDLLAHNLKVPRTEAQRLKALYFSKLPHVKKLIKDVMRTAEVRGYICNWMGRRCYFPNKDFAYKAPNYLISGGCADIVKVAMNRLDDLLMGKKSRMILQVHDELLFEIAFGEEYLIPQIKEIMESVYPYRLLPMQVDMEVAYKSWADKEAYGSGTGLQEEGSRLSGGVTPALGEQTLVLQDAGSSA